MSERLNAARARVTSLIEVYAPVRAGSHCKGELTQAVDELVSAALEEGDGYKHEPLVHIGDARPNELPGQMNLEGGGIDWQRPVDPQQGYRPPLGVNEFRDVPPVVVPATPDADRPHVAPFAQGDGTGRTAEDQIQQAVDVATGTPELPPVSTADGAPIGPVGPSGAPREVGEAPPVPVGDMFKDEPHVPDASKEHAATPRKRR